MSSRRADVFFYGLFMDQDLLRSKGLTPEGVELATVEGYQLRIGQRAALARQPSGRVHGVVMSLPLSDLERLYSEPGLRAYTPEPILVQLAGGGAIAALCYNLVEPPPLAERNPDYAIKLQGVARKVGLPAEYVASLA